MTPSPGKSRLQRRLLVRRLLPLLLLDVAISAGALLAALVLRFEGAIEDRYLAVAPYCAAFMAVLKAAFLFLFGLYKVQWRYAGLRDLARIGYASALGSLAFVTLTTFLQFGGIPQALPRSVIVIDFMISTALFAAVRLVPRMLSHLPSGTTGRSPTLIYGAGAAAEQLVRDMLRHREYPHFPAAFIDDDPHKWGTTIHGIPVLGDGNRIAAAMAKTGAETVIVAIPSASARQVRRILDKTRAADVTETKILPGLGQIVKGEVTVSLIRDVNLEDLMGRKPVEIETDAVRGYLAGKRVLITGAAGSIGSELTRQVLQFGPERLCLVDHDETDLYHLAESLRGTDRPVEAQVADIRDAERMESVFASVRPQVVFHAAAYKHVPMIEAHPVEAVKTNVVGTRNLAGTAERNGTEKFILVSTDKAVNPSSVMGVSKRVAEMVIREQGQTGNGLFAAVRFGNVLGSRGSVVPIFREQIARGGPVTVTHPEMKRYFMTIREACLLVLQAAALAQNGSVLVLDMGEPVLIADLAAEMIRLSGFEPETDIPIEFTGVRPGEKLFEEYLTAEEGVDATRHEKIHMARITRDLSGDLFRARLAELLEACAAQDEETVRDLLRQMVPTYRTPPRSEPSSTPAQRGGETS